MEPLKRSPAKNTKSTETADTTTYQVVGELTKKRSVVITGAGAHDFSRKLFLEEESFGILVHATRTCRETQNSCLFTSGMFRPERDSAKKQTKRICVGRILSVNRAISIGKKLEGN